MSVRGPRARWIEVPQAGHAPDLFFPDLVEAVAGFIEHSLEEVRA
jgi:hypothetical protein